MRRYRVEVPTEDYWRRQINCQYACPVNTDARGYVRAIADGRFDDAYLIARGPNPLASICGRVCGAPCEAACRRGDIDQAVSIRALKRFAQERFAARHSGSQGVPPGLLRRLMDHAAGRNCSAAEELGGMRQILGDGELPNNEGGEPVAIIGSGPAGLAAAHDLALLGCRPTIFEMEPIPAGMLAVGIPQYRLPHELIETEVEFIRSLGVEFVCNTEIGRDISMAEIRGQHRATVIAVGLKRSRSLPIPGHEGKGILGGVELLRDVALKMETELTGDVVVIGGGNVAYDIARTVVRQTGVDISRTALRRPGVKSVHLCSLESLDELPADDLEIMEGDEEGVVRHHSLGPKEILLNEEGRARGVLFQRCTRVFDEDGRFAPHFDESQLETVPADTVVWGIGQRPELSFVDTEEDIRRTERGMIDCNQDTLQTSADDVFVAGDIAYGPRLLIDAVASGKEAARAVVAYLRGQRPAKETTLVHLDLPDYAREQDYEKLDRTPIPALSADERTAAQTTSAQTTVVELGYDEQLAVREGCRCLDCGVNTIFDSDKCILCGGCADVCPELCLELVSLDRLDGSDGLGQAIRERLGDEPLSQHSAIVKDETKCIRCALCAQRCPVGAITMERVHFETCWT
jgi:formate dehydrogenase beta subunit